MLNQGLYFLINALLDIASVLLLARFLIQASNADFYNPIAQGIVKITDPVCKPLRKLLPTFKNLDFASFVMAWVIKGLAIVIAIKLEDGTFPSLLAPLVIGLQQTLYLIITIYWFALIIIVILSFLAPGNYHPAAMLMHQITEPLVAPIRRVIPPVGGLDFSVLVVFLLIIFVRDYLLPVVFSIFY